jgi:hypothetical protein
MRTIWVQFQSAHERVRDIAPFISYKMMQSMFTFLFLFSLFVDVSHYEGFVNKQTILVYIKCISYSHVNVLFNLLYQISKGIIKVMSPRMFLLINFNHYFASNSFIIITIIIVVAFIIIIIII